MYGVFVKVIKFMNCGIFRGLKLIKGKIKKGVKEVFF